MITIAIVPSNAYIARQAIDLFGGARVNPDYRERPVYVRELSEDEVAFAKEFFKEIGCEVALTSQAD